MSVKNKLGTLALIMLTIFTVHRMVGAKYYSVDLVLVSTVFSFFYISNSSIFVRVADDDKYNIS